MSEARRTFVLPRPKILERWSTTLPEPASPPPEGLSLTTLRRVVRLLRPFWHRAALALALGVSMIWITTLIPALTGRIIDEGVVARDSGTMVRLVGLLL